MKITELPVGSKVNLSLKVKGRILQFNAKVAIVLADRVLLDPIKREGKTVGFGNYDVQLVYIGSDKDKPIVWLKPKISLVKYRGETFHQIITFNNGQVLNRRDGIRQPVGVSAKAIAKNFTSEITILDISANGISFLSDKPAPHDSQIRISFKDLNYNFNLAVEVCWFSEAENGNQFNYGCKIISKNVKIENYIKEKQAATSTEAAGVVKVTGKSEAGNTPNADNTADNNAPSGDGKA